MTTLLSLDGGNRKATKKGELDRASYVAHYGTGDLLSVFPCTLERARCCELRGLAVAVERPDCFQRGAPPNVIAGVAWNVCRIAYTLAQGAPVHEYTVHNGEPTDWIGTVAKPVLHQRIWAALTLTEQRVFGLDTAFDLDKASEHYARTKRILQHAAFNTLDAAGVGLFHLGRIKKGGAKP